MLCDSKNLLARINKNLVYDIINARPHPERPINQNFLDSWFAFVFNYYFKLIFAFVRLGDLQQVKPAWKNIIHINDSTSFQEFLDLKSKGKVMVSLYKVPKWLADEELPEYKESDRANYLFLMFNPKAENGKKVTLSYHKTKLLDEVKNAEIQYTKLLTTKTLIGIVLASFLFLADWVETTYNVPFLSNLILFIAAAFIIFDIYQLLLIINNKGLNNVITNFRKSMSGRIDSSSTLKEVEHLLRVEKTLVADFMIDLLKSKRLNIHDPSQVYLNVNRKFQNISKNYVVSLLKELDEIGLIEVHQNGDVIILAEELMHNKRVFHERLYEQFDLNKPTQDLIYSTFQAFIDTINMLLDSENLQRIRVDIC
ncbi:MAG: hypothetical protein INQ03_09840 [Candidatus Heimdallarchaeota archaeon]|nr:hypothetical protein [Candidatus Heimdallarchaeota archaeon]